MIIFQDVSDFEIKLKYSPKWIRWDFSQDFFWGSSSWSLVSSHQNNSLFQDFYVKISFFGEGAQSDNQKHGSLMGNFKRLLGIILKGSDFEYVVAFCV